jgi:hypothetical protein
MNPHVEQGMLRKYISELEAFYGPLPTRPDGLLPPITAATRVDDVRTADIDRSTGAGDAQRVGVSKSWA